MKKYLSSTFTPSMLDQNVKFAIVYPITLKDAVESVDGALSYIGHETSCRIYEKLINRSIEFNRDKINALSGDEIITIIPLLRDNHSREFNEIEMELADYKCFRIRVL